jgi:hypothetical protein
MFVPNSDDPPEQRIVDKMVAAGWIKKAVRVAKPTSSDPYASTGNVEWTEKGKLRTRSLIGLLEAIERNSTRVCNEELIWLRAYAEMAVASSDGGSFLPPNSPTR